VISLGAVAAASLATRIGVLVSIAIIMTVAVYGLVAGIVKLDDLGLRWVNKGGALAPLGRGILVFAPWLMKFLSIAGTAAMFLVGGGILTHGIAALHHLVERLTAGGTGTVQLAGAMLVDAVAGIVAGAVVLLLVTLGTKLWKSMRPTPAV
jgi:uncharacterized protein